MLRGGDNARAPPAAASDNVRDELSQVRLRRRKKGFTNKATREQRRQRAADTTRSCLEAPGAAWALAPDKLKERGLAGPGAGPGAGPSRRKAQGARARPRHAACRLHDDGRRHDVLLRRRIHMQFTQGPAPRQNRFVSSQGRERGTTKSFWASTRAAERYN